PSPRRLPTPTLFPYTTLFRSGEARDHAGGLGHRRSPYPGFSPRRRRRRSRRSRGRRAEKKGEACLALQEDEEAGEARLAARRRRSEEHTSELQSRENLVCRLL